MLQRAECGMRSDAKCGMRGGCILAGWLAALLLAQPVFAADRYALVVSGTSGAPKYADQQRTWVGDLVRAFGESFGFEPSRITTLTEDATEATGRSNAENVRRVLGELRSRATRDDLLVVILVGHGTFDGEVAKFNLIGPDLTSDEWADLLSGLPARLVLVDTTESSYPFLERLSQRGRIVVTATDSAAQRYATVFPEYLIRAFTSPATDADKNGRISVWEVFAAASAGVRQHYDQKGQLPTERPLLDDTGDRFGKEAEASGPDGALARTVFLDAEVTEAASGAVAAALQRRRSALEAQLEWLKQRKRVMGQEEYEAELEQVLVALAKVWREIRRGS